MDVWKEYFKKDRFALECGIELMEAGPGYAKVRMSIEPRHLNAMGIVHGGAVFTVADFAFAVASNSYGTIAVAINTTLSIIKASSSGTLYAEAVEESKNPKLGMYTVKVTNDDGEMVALFQGMAYRKKTPLQDFI